MIAITSKKLNHLLLNTVPPGSNVLYCGCSNGYILNRLRPKYGLGIDTNKDIINQARKKYPYLVFESKGILNLKIEEKFDFIVFDEFLPYISDVFLILKHVRSICKDNGKLIISSIPKIRLLSSVNWLFKRKNTRFRNWIPKQLLNTLLYLSNFWPRPEVHSCIIADTMKIKNKRKYSYSIIIPAYDEERNIIECVNRIPNLKRDYEIIIVNDGSKDRTAERVKEIMKKNKRIRFIDYKNNNGKGYATKLGLDASKKEVLMILDADMTVKPEDLPLFIEPFESKTAEFVNGTRMVYRMEDEAMRPINIFGNKIFSIIFSYLLNQNVTDTLCGTKCIFKKDYNRIKMEDKAWPDFDLLFGAAKLNLKIVEMPIWYQKRIAGESKMRVIKHGWMLLKASIRGFIELKLKM